MMTLKDLRNNYSINLDLKEENLFEEENYEEEVFEGDMDLFADAETTEIEISYQEIENKLINFLMVNGKKSKAAKIFKEAGILLAQEEKLQISDLLLQALLFTSPPIKIRFRRRGSQKVRVPFPLTAKQRENQGLKLIVEEARKGKNQSLAKNLAYEIKSASEGKGKAVERQRQIAQDAQKSRGNLFLRWS